MHDDGNGQTMMMLVESCLGWARASGFSAVINVGLVRPSLMRATMMKLETFEIFIIMVMVLTIC